MLMMGDDETGRADGILTPSSNQQHQVPSSYIRVREDMKKEMKVKIDNRASFGYILNKSTFYQNMYRKGQFMVLNYFLKIESKS